MVNNTCTHNALLSYRHSFWLFRIFIEFASISKVATNGIANGRQSKAIVNISLKIQNQLLLGCFRSHYATRLCGYIVMVKNESLWSTRLVFYPEKWRQSHRNQLVTKQRCQNKNYYIYSDVKYQLIHTYNYIQGIYYIKLSIEVCYSLVYTCTNTCYRHMHRIDT